MSESVLAASDFSLETSWKQAEKGPLSPFECLSFANTIQADLPTCASVLFWGDYLQYLKKNLTYIQNFFKKEWITTIYKYYYKIYSGSMSSEKPAFSNSNLNKILL